MTLTETAEFTPVGFHASILDKGDGDGLVELGTGGWKMTLLATDTLEDRQEDACAPELLERWARQICDPNEARVVLSLGHTDPVGFADCVHARVVPASEVIPGAPSTEMAFLVDAQLDPSIPAAQRFVTQYRAGKSFQFSIGGQLAKTAGATSVTRVNGRRIRRLNNVNLTHIAVTWADRAVNPRTGVKYIGEEVWKSLDEYEARFTEQRTETQMTTLQEALNALVAQRENVDKSVEFLYVEGRTAEESGHSHPFYCMAFVEDGQLLGNTEPSSSANGEEHWHPIDLRGAEAPVTSTSTRGKAHSHSLEMGSLKEITAGTYKARMDAMSAVRSRSATDCATETSPTASTSTGGVLGWLRNLLAPGAEHNPIPMIQAAAEEIAGSDNLPSAQRREAVEATLALARGLAKHQPDESAMTVPEYKLFRQLAQLETPPQETAKPRGAETAGSTEMVTESTDTAESTTDTDISATVTTETSTETSVDEATVTADVAPKTEPEPSQPAVDTADLAAMVSREVAEAMKGVTEGILNTFRKEGLLPRSETTGSGNAPVSQSAPEKSATAPEVVSAKTDDTDAVTALTKEIEKLRARIVAYEKAPNGSKALSGQDEVAPKQPEKASLFSGVIRKPRTL